MRRIAFLLVAVLAGSAGAAPAKSARPAKARQARTASFTGHNAPKAEYRTEPLGKPSGDLWFRAENLGEQVRVNIYKPDGNFDDAALAKLDDLFRCVSTGKVRAVRAELYEQLSRIQDHFDHKTLVLVSGFRAAIGSTVERTSSRHYHASAADFRIEGVSIYEIRKYAESLDMGNMGIGIYPTSQFVHVDFRAPGEPSYRWVDNSGHGKPAKRPGRTQPARKPVS
ncbi:MAG: hypothetical protein H6Q90_2373 [Deltaproteobacteria bacterium]|nr:hypothetical protein [Deltaproteobacteria bacterium]